MPLSAYTQPIAGLILGVVIFAVAAIFNWYGDLKAVTIRRIATAIFGKSPLAIPSAEAAFRVATNVFVAVSGVLIITALLFLSA